jgi:DNA-binding response OmpR family regulator
VTRTPAGRWTAWSRELLRRVFRARPAGRSVIIATNDDEWCEPIAAELKRSGLEVVVIDDVQEACAIAERDSSRLVLVDSVVLRWPGRARVLRPIARRQPVVVASAPDDVGELVELALREGIAAVVPRTLDAGSMVGCLETLRRA